MRPDYPLQWPGLKQGTALPPGAFIHAAARFRGDPTRPQRGGDRAGSSRLDPGLGGAAGPQERRRQSSFVLRIRSSSVNQ